MTVIVDRHPDLPAILSSTPTIDLQMPNHPFTRTLLGQTGPLATISANISGHSDAINITDVLAQWAKQIDLLLDGGTISGGQPPTIVDCTREPPVVLHQGTISMEQILGVLSS